MKTRDGQLKGKRMAVGHAGVKGRGGRRISWGSAGREHFQD